MLKVKNITEIDNIKLSDFQKGTHSDIKIWTYLLWDKYDLEIWYLSTLKNKYTWRIVWKDWIVLTSINSKDLSTLKEKLKEVSKKYKLLINDLSFQETFDFKDSFWSTIPETSEEYLNNVFNSTLKKRIEDIRNQWAYKSFNPDSIYSRIVLEDLWYDWNKIMFKDRWSKGYLIKISKRSNWENKREVKRYKIWF